MGPNFQCAKGLDRPKTGLHAIGLDQISSVLFLIKACIYECVCCVNDIWWIDLLSEYKIEENSYYCEDHIDRGCSCQLELDQEGNEIPDSALKDDQVRELTCCEYDFSEDGFDN